MTKAFQLGLAIVAILLLVLSMISSMELVWEAWSAGIQSYEAMGELLLVFVIALEGVAAIVALMFDRMNLREDANEAVFNLHKMYMSVEYHEHVRRPAWLALWKARRCPEYETRLVKQLVGDGDAEFMELQIRRQKGLLETQLDRD